MGQAKKLVLAVAAAILLWKLADVVLLAFAGGLFALLLRTPADWLARRTPLSPGWALALVVVVALAILGTGGWFFGAQIADQLGELAAKLPELFEHARERLQEHDWLSRVLSSGEGASNAKVVSRGFNVLAATLQGLAYIAVVFFTGLFLAAQPRLYRRGALKLVPPAHRERASALLDEIGAMLRDWLVGQAVLMVTIGVVTWIGLKLLGVPMALALGILAGVLEFVPYLGPIASAVPALLVALAQSPTLAAYVLLLYFGIQSLEGHILQPLVQRRAVSLPPALLLIAQVVFGTLLGVLGVMLATPVTATLMVVVKRLYVEDALGDRG